MKGCRIRSLSSFTRLKFELDDPGKRKTKKHEEKEESKAMSQLMFPNISLSLDQLSF